MWISTHTTVCKWHMSWQCFPCEMWSGHKTSLWDEMLSNESTWYTVLHFNRFFWKLILTKKFALVLLTVLRSFSIPCKNFCMNGHLIGGGYTIHDGQHMVVWLYVSARYLLSTMSIVHWLSRAVYIRTGWEMVVCTLWLMWTSNSYQEVE